MNGLSIGQFEEFGKAVWLIKSTQKFDIDFKTIILRLTNRKKSFGSYNVHTPHSLLDEIVSLDVLVGLP